MDVLKQNMNKTLVDIVDKVTSLESVSAHLTSASMSKPEI